MHWFNPSHLILLIEIIKGDKTLDTVAQAIKELSIHIGKKPVIVQKDVLGFAANRIQFAVLREALYLVEQGVISKEDIAFRSGSAANSSAVWVLLAIR